MSATKRKAGRPRGRTYPVRLQLTLTRQAAKELREISKAQQLTVNEFVRRSIEGGVLKHLRAKSAMEMSRLLDAAEAHLSTASENPKREIPVSEHHATTASELKWWSNERHNHAKQPAPSP